jgi:hypothetical protein
MTLLIVCPVINVAASVPDPRTHPEAADSRLQVVNDALSIVAVVATAVTSTNDTSAAIPVSDGNGRSWSVGPGPPSSA